MQPGRFRVATGRRSLAPGNLEANTRRHPDQWPTSDHPGRPPTHAPQHPSLRRVLLIWRSCPKPQPSRALRTFAESLLLPHHKRISCGARQLHPDALHLSVVVDGPVPIFPPVPARLVPAKWRRGRDRAVCVDPHGASL